jgi:hypothetical protein
LCKKHRSDQVSFTTHNLCICKPMFLSSFNQGITFSEHLQLC